MSRSAEEHPGSKDSAPDSTLLGGVFGLERIGSTRSAIPAFLGGSPLLMVNARSCLWALLRNLKPRQVWLPGYLCKSIVHATRQAGAHYSFYEVDYDLKNPELTWLEKVQPNDLVLVIAYFGFPADRTLCQAAKERGAVVVLDASQALLTQDGTLVDFVFYSPRKFVGVPDGGVLQRRCSQDLAEVALTPSDDRWWLDALDATLLRRDFDRGDGNREWFPRYQAAEAAHPVGAIQMSDLTRRILYCGVDYDHLASRRRENYLALSSELRDIAFFPDLPTGVVPVGFPVRVPRRDRALAALYNQQIFPPVHWRLPEEIPANYQGAWQLADQMMTLPCDQRYTTDHMAFLAREMRKAVD